MKIHARALWLLASMLAAVNTPGAGQSGVGEHTSGLMRGGALSDGRRSELQPPHRPATFRKSPRRTPGALMPLGVRRRVPQDYATIQAAISASTDGDTVLVSNGTYLENISFEGKAIIVASLYLVDGDTSHIDQTIIDGSNSSDPDYGSVVYFISGEDTNSVLCGFTVRGGTGTRVSDGGIWYRGGGGVYCSFSGARLTRNVITRNRCVSSSAYGGGIGAEFPDSLYLILEGNRVTDNLVKSDSAATWGYSGGADIYGIPARIVGNVFERDTVIGVGSAIGGGMSFYTGDTTAPFPDAYIQGNIFRANVVQSNLRAAVGAGLYIGRTGDVTVRDNVFEANVGTSVAGWAQGGGMLVEDDRTGIGRKVVEHNRIVNNRLTHGGTTVTCGSGVALYNTITTLNGNEVTDNTADGSGAGVMAYRSSFRIENNIIARNVTTTSAGGVDVLYAPRLGTEQVIVNNTFTGNRAGGYGGGLRVTGSGASVWALNNILWRDTATVGREVYVQGAYVGVHYCNVDGGWTGVRNINADPGFEVGGFGLGETSPCIGAGRDTLTTIPVTDFYGQPRPQPLGSNPDIGACENALGLPVGVDEDQDAVPLSFGLSQNYPNPFNAISNFGFRIAKWGMVELDVFDLLGREVATLVNEVKEPGTYTVQWDAGGFASGVYLYRLRAGEFVQVRRMLVLR